MPCLLLGPFSPEGRAEPGTLSGVLAPHIESTAVRWRQSKA